MMSDDKLVLLLFFFFAIIVKKENLGCPKSSKILPKLSVYGPEFLKCFHKLNTTLGVTFKSLEICT